MADTKQKEIRRALAWFLIPALVLAGFFFVNGGLGLTNAGLIALGLGLSSLVVYNIKTYREELLGIKTKNFGKVTLWALVFSFGFYIINQINPIFQLGFPNVSLSLTENARFFIIGFLFPILEEFFFRSVIFGLLLEYYKNLKWGISNIIQAGLFSLFHLTAYGLGFSSFENISQLLSGFNAISGLFIAAFVMGLIWGYFTRKFGNLWFSILSHIIINIILLTLVVVAF